MQYNLLIVFIIPSLEFSEASNTIVLCAWLFIYVQEINVMLSIYLFKLAKLKGNLFYGYRFFVECGVRPSLNKTLK